MLQSSIFCGFDSHSVPLNLAMCQYKNKLNFLNNYIFILLNIFKKAKLMYTGSQQKVFNCKTSIQFCYNVKSWKNRTIIMILSIEDGLLFKIGEVKKIYLFL